MMSSKECEKAGAGLHENLQLLRSAAHSHATSEISIITDASEYIKKLKQKVDELDQEIIAIHEGKLKNNSIPSVTVETRGHGSFLVNVSSQKNCPELLVSILEAFADLGINVLEATASCGDTFRLEAVGGENMAKNVDEHVVKQAVLQAIGNFKTGGREE